jgi:hypothetical protein
LPYRRDDLCATDRNLGDFEMSDPKNDEATGSEAATEQETLHPAKPHHKDKGTIVTTAFGEKMSGGIADITDGDE